MVVKPMCPHCYLPQSSFDVSVLCLVQLAEEDELMWDDGTWTPEPCLDKFDLVTKVRHVLG